MRPDILNHGYKLRTKVLFAVIRLVSRRPLPDAAKLTFYRPGFYGAPAREFTHETMRGPSPWSVAERELMAAYISAVNGNAFCTGAHSATAGQAYQDPALVAAVLANPDTAPIGEPLRATLGMLGTLTTARRLSAAGLRAALAAGVSPEQVRDALAVAAAFAATNRLADAFGFQLLTPDGYQAGAKVLLDRGYR
jgi:uncharacterized peroxidase-related enzyme